MSIHAMAVNIVLINSFIIITSDQSIDLERKITFQMYDDILHSTFYMLTIHSNHSYMAFFKISTNKSLSSPLRPWWMHRVYRHSHKRYQKDNLLGGCIHFK